MKTLIIILTVLITFAIFGISESYAQYGEGFSPVEHYPTINNTKLQLLVMNSTDFKEKTLGHNYTFAGINYDWISKGNNNYDFGGAGVTFFVHGFDNETTKGEVFNIDSQMKIKNIFEYNADYPPVGYFSTTCYGGCNPSDLSQLNKKLEAAKGIIESMMMGPNTSGIPFNEVGIFDGNFTLGVGIDSAKSTISEEEYLKKIKEIVGDIPIKITLGRIQLLSESTSKKQEILSPLQQFREGRNYNEISCRPNFELIKKAEDGSPACVTPETADHLKKIGWLVEIGRGYSTDEYYTTCNTWYTQSDSGMAVFYMPTNYTGKICVRYNNLNNTPTGIGMRIFEANNLTQNASNVIAWTDNDTLEGNANKTIVYFIKTGAQVGFYGVSLNCGGFPLAVGYDANSTLTSSDFPWLGQTFHCGVITYDSHIEGTEGIGVRYIPISLK